MHTCIITGHTAADLTLRYTPEHTAYTQITLIDNRVWKDKTTQDKQKEAVAFHLALFGVQAEHAVRYIGKGSAIAVRCHARQAQYDKDGVTHYGYDFFIDELDYVSLKPPASASKAPPS